MKTAGTAMSAFSLYESLLIDPVITFSGPFVTDEEESSIAAVWQRILDAILKTSAQG